MSVFQDVTLDYDGNAYTVKSNKVMMLIAEVEDVITLGEMTSGSKVPLAKVAMGYAAALNFAGAKVGTDEVYQSLFQHGSDGAVSAVAGLMALMIPPGAIEKKPKAAKKRKAAKK